MVEIVDHVVIRYFHVLVDDTVVVDVDLQWQGRMVALPHAVRNMDDRPALDSHALMRKDLLAIGVIARQIQVVARRAIDCESEFTLLLILCDPNQKLLKEVSKGNIRY